MPLSTAVADLLLVGRTVRHREDGLPVYGVLVVGEELTSHFWLNILPLSQDRALRFYIPESDLVTLDEHLHVRPSVVPSFLVMVHGYPVDWFPAPLPGPAEAADPRELLGQVYQRLRQYH